MKFGVGNFEIISVAASDEAIRDEVDRVLDNAIDDKIANVNATTDKKIENLSANVDKKLTTKADLGVDGKLLDDQIPASVEDFMTDASSTFDDVLEFDSFNDLPIPGDSGIIYIANGSTYYWDDDLSRYKATAGTLTDSSTITDEDINDIFE